MTLREYVHYMNKMLQERPKLADLKLVSSISEDEMTGFEMVKYVPTVGYYSEGKFLEEGTPEFEDSGESINAFCVN